MVAPYFEIFIIMKNPFREILIITALLIGLVVLSVKAPGQGSNPKSVVLSEFYAVIMSDTAAVIYWTTESETNSYQWRLERAVDSLGPYQIRATLPAAGNSSMPTDYQYLDHPLHPDTLYYYRLAEIDLGGATTYFGPITVCTGVEGEPAPKLKVGSLKLLPNAPNPFGQMTIIRYQITTPGKVSLKVYNMAGRCVKELVSDYKDVGWHEVRWSGRDDKGIKVPNGVYLIKLISGKNKSYSNLSVVR